MDREGVGASLAQATVVADSATEADALSTAMLVRGRAWPGVRSSITLKIPA
jgi:thiamine biosynthesis lipoprotein ApbE